MALVTTRPKLQQVYQLFPWLVLVGALGLTVFAWHLTSRQAETLAHEEFGDRARQLASSIVTRMAAYEQILHGTRGLFAASSDVERREWRDYVAAQHLDTNYPGVLGLAYAAFIPAAALATHEHSVRAEGFADYHVWPTGRRREYSAIVYIEPFTGRNLRAFGYDMYSQPIRHAAMDRARGSGQAALTGKVRLVQENGGHEQAGTLLYLPVYRRGAATATEAQRRSALRGWAYMPFRMDDLMHGLLPQGQLGLQVVLYDGTPDARQLLYSSLPAGAESGAHRPRFDETLEIPLYGRQWLLRVRSTPLFEQQVASDRPQLVATGGLAVSLLCFGFTWSLARTRRRALELAGQMTGELARSEQRYSSLVNLSKDGIFALDRRFRISYANPHMSTLFGYATAELLGRTCLDLISPQARPAAQNTLQRYARDGGGSCETEMLRSDGSTFTALVSAHAIVDENGQFDSMVSVVTDVSSLKKTERRLAMLTSLIEFSSDPFFVLDPGASFRLVFVNDAACRHFGKPRAELLQTHIWDWDPNFTLEQMQVLWQRLQQEKTLAFETETHVASGELVPVEVSINYLAFEGDDYAAGYFRDIRQRRAKEAQAHHLAHHDALTGLPNRSLLADRVKQALAQARRMETGVTLMFLDLDDFKPVNDTLGHDVGDRLLKDVAKRLQGCVRESDTVARLGGDEFVLLLPQTVQSTDAETVARKVVEEVARPYTVAGHPIEVTASLGIACYPLHAQNEQLLMKHADIAMYQSKRAGRNRYSFYSAPLGQPEP